jgi:hypothetical protein
MFSHSRGNPGKCQPRMKLTAKNIHSVLIVLNQLLTLDLALQKHCFGQPAFGAVHAHMDSAR